MQYITLLIGLKDTLISEQYTRLASGKYTIVIAWKLELHVFQIPHGKVNSRRLFDLYTDQ